ncbi:MAG: hypothetical protein AAFQ65_12590 [Myxococcota bacterium]
MTGPDLIVVTGLPRSGTSMMMRALGAGGARLYYDQARPPDRHNPHGYFELERVKSLRDDPNVLDELTDGAVKVVYPLVCHLNPKRRYHLLVLRRPIADIVRSQDRMLSHEAAQEDFVRLFETELERFDAWLHTSAHITATDVEFDRMRIDPLAECRRLAERIPTRLDSNRMAAAVVPNG